MIKKIDYEVSRILSTKIRTFKILRNGLLALHYNDRTIRFCDIYTLKEKIIL